MLNSTQPTNLNPMVFWNEVIEALDIRIANWVQSTGKVFTEEYFEFYKDNPFHTYGRMCLALKQAKEERQKISDGLKAALAVDSVQGDKK